MDISYDRFNKEKHLHILEKWEEDGELYSYLSHLRPRSLRESNPELVNQTSHFMISIEGIYIGSAWLEDITTDSAKLGIYIAEKDYRCKGIGEKTLEFLIRLGFTELRLDRLLLNVREKNERAIKLYKKMGFIVLKENNKKVMCNGSYQGWFEMELKKGSKDAPSVDAF